MVFAYSLVTARKYKTILNKDFPYVIPVVTLDGVAVIAQTARSVQAVVRMTKKFNYLFDLVLYIY